MNSLKTWLYAGLCASALVAGTAVQAQPAAPAAAARAPAEAFPLPGSPTIYKSAAELDKVLKEQLALKGPLSVSLVQLTDRTSLNIVRRDQANDPIAHRGWSEVHYIMDGSATAEVGGTVQRGAVGIPTVTGAVSKRVKKGDFVFIPANSPHHYKDLDGHVTYYEIRFPDVPSTAPPSAAQAALAPAPAAGGPGLFFSGDELAAAMTKAVAANSAQAVVPVLVTNRFSINEIQRGAPNPALGHAGANEMLYILSGSGTLATGGKITGTGTARLIEGGVSRTVQAGDVIIVPADTPHNFTAMNPAVTYLEVRFPNAPGEQSGPPPAR